MKFIKNFNYFKFFIFFLFAMIIQWLQYQLYFFDKYLDATSRIQGHKFNFSKNYKDLFWLNILIFSYCGICLLIYIGYYIYKIPLLIVATLTSCMFGIWDAYPMFMLDINIKEIPILLFDQVFAGAVWVLITIPLFNKYYSVLKNNVPILLILYILLLSVIMYRFYTYNRANTQNNKFVKFGDKVKDLIIT